MHCQNNNIINMQGWEFFGMGHVRIKSCAVGADPALLRAIQSITWTWGFGEESQVLLEMCLTFIFLYNLFSRMPSLVSPYSKLYCKRFRGQQQFMP